MTAIFQDRADAGRQLAARLRSLKLKDPLVLAIPRGGLEVAAPVARALGAELDVVLSRKLRAPRQPELAIGAVSESGEFFASPDAGLLPVMPRWDEQYLAMEREHQVAEIRRRAVVFREVRPRAHARGRSVIVIDDGIATGSTMIAALRTARSEGAAELIVAVPVAPRDRLEEIGAGCDHVICLHAPEDFYAIGQFYRDFGQVDESRAIDLLREAARDSGKAHAPPARPK